MRYDLIIENGRVIDFTTRTERQETLYIVDGKIVSPPPAGLQVNAVQHIDATDKLVLPGFIDEHAHYNYEGNNVGVNADILSPASGVTTVVDAGTAGWANYELFHKATIIRSVTRILSYLHVSTYGNHSFCDPEENHDPRNFNEQKIIALFEKYPETLRGLKVRMCRETTTGLGLAPLEKAIEIAEKIRDRGIFCPVVAHFSELPEDSSLEGILQLLRQGDVFAHVFQNKGETIFDNQMKVKNCVWKAKEKGVLFDNCHGRIHWSLAGISAAVQDGFLPDLISSDVIRESTFVYPGFSLLHAMNACYAAGMDLVDIFARVTVNAAAALGKSNEIGSLAVGRSADIVVVDMMPTQKRIYDRFNDEIMAKELIVPLLTIRNGEIVFRQMFF